MKPLSFVLVILASFAASAEVRRVDYNGYTLWIDCEKRSAVRFEYFLGKDTGDEPRKRYKEYRRDPSLGDCQQLSTNSYQRETSGTFQRGHLVPFNHLDSSQDTATDANQMANILAQHQVLNSGAWQRAEEIAECHREFENLRITGGALWDGAPRPLKTHGIDIPDRFWKVIEKNGDWIAWIMPNDETATAEMLDTVLISLRDVEKESGAIFDPAYDKEAKVERSWDVAKCDQLGEWKR